MKEPSQNKTAFFSGIIGDIKDTGLAFAALLTALALTGGFAEFFSIAVSAVVSVFLIICIIKNKNLRIRFDLTLAAVLIIALFYLIASIYAVDRGSALLGFCKFMPVPLFAVLLMQREKQAEKLLRLLPYIAMITGIVSLILSFIFPKLFMTDGRQGGFFQYPNTYAAFLMTAELLALSRTDNKTLNYSCAAALFLLIILTQSRAVFVLTVVFSLIILFIKGAKKQRIILGVSVGALAVAVILLYPLLSQNEFFGRFLSLSVFESTFAGRLLYWYDALPLMIKHPFGMGYLGYYFTEHSIQSGVYSVRFIHNDILQLILDAGFIPALAFLAIMFRHIFSPKADFGCRTALIALLLHFCFDFDLQYTAMWFILLILLYSDGVTLRSAEISLKPKSASIISAVCIAVSAYFTLVCGLGFFGNTKAALGMYPIYTEQQIKLLSDTSDPKQMSDIADSIISHNKYVHLAYSAKSRAAFSQGDVEKLIEYKRKVFDTAPFVYEEYEEYAAELIYCAEMYAQAGDTAGAEICRGELVATRERLRALDDKLSYLGRVIKDRPKTALPDEIESYIDNIG